MMRRDPRNNGEYGHRMDEMVGLIHHGIIPMILHAFMSPKTLGNRAMSPTGTPDIRLE